VGDAGASYTRAQAAREVLRDEFEAVLDGVDALLLPTMPDIAPLLEDAADPGFDYARNTRPANVTRLPALTLPHGTVDGLPVGVQLVGEAFSEAQLLGIGAAVEPRLESPSA
jgi:Asp-tRNA(Asn)/Glu-tRNA(Gln) amidotransferase A subunit family amidase